MTGVELRRAILFVKDLERLAAFYGRTLGLDLQGGTARPGWVELGTGAARLALHAVPAEIASRIALAEPAAAREDSPIKLVFAVADVAKERVRLVHLGVHMLELKPWGACDGLDPEGNVFQIVKA